MNSTEKLTKFEGGKRYTIDSVQQADFFIGATPQHSRHSSLLDPVLDPRQNLSLTQSTLSASSDEDDEESRDAITDLEDARSTYSLKDKAAKRFSARIAKSSTQYSASTTPSSSKSKRRTPQ